MSESCAICHRELEPAELVFGEDVEFGPVCVQCFVREITTAAEHHEGLRAALRERSLWVDVDMAIVRERAPFVDDYEACIVHIGDGVSPSDVAHAQRIVEEIVRDGQWGPVILIQGEGSLSHATEAEMNAAGWYSKAHLTELLGEFLGTDAPTP